MCNLFNWYLNNFCHHKIVEIMFYLFVLENLLSFFLKSFFYDKYLNNKNINTDDSARELNKTKIQIHAFYAISFHKI